MFWISSNIRAVGLRKTTKTVMCFHYFNASRAVQYHCKRERTEECFLFLGPERLRIGPRQTFPPVQISARKCTHNEIYLFLLLSLLKIGQSATWAFLREGRKKDKSETRKTLKVFFSAVAVKSLSNGFALRTSRLLFATDSLSPSAFSMCNVVGQRQVYYAEVLVQLYPSCCSFLFSLFKVRILVCVCAVHSWV